MSNLHIHAQLSGITTERDDGGSQGLLASRAFWIGGFVSAGFWVLLGWGALRL